MQRTKGGKKKTDAVLDNSVDGEDSVKGSKESEDGSGAIKEKTRSAKRRNFKQANRQKKVSNSEKDASESGLTDNASSSPSKGKSVDGTVSS